MAVTSCYPSQRSGGLGMQGLRQVGKAMVTWKIETDSAQGWLDTYTQARAVSSPMVPLPARGTTYDVLGETDSALYCQSIDFKQPMELKRDAWLVDVGYGVLPAGFGAADFVADPIQRPIRYWWETEHYTEPVEKAVLLQDIARPGGYVTTPRVAAGTEGPIQNAYGNDYDETLMKNRRRLILVARKNTNDLAGTGQLILDFDDSVNDSLFFGADARQAEFRDISFSDEITENGITYWQATFRIALSTETFDVDIVNRGWWYWSVTDYGTPSVVSTRSKVTGAEPELLAADGRRLSDVEGMYEKGNTIPYRVHSKVLDYSGLGIGVGI